MFNKFSYYFKEGLPKGESDYFIATEEELDRNNPLKDLKKVKWAIYDKNGKRVSDFYDWISPLGIVKGQSEYFRATKNGKEAIFTLEKQVTDWFDKIRDRGALTGESDYFWGKLNGFYALYDIKTGEKITENYKSSVIAGAVVGRSNYIVGSYGEEIFFIVDIGTGQKVSKDFDEHKLIEILKHGDLEKALKEINKGGVNPP
ncbi:hypothetical protein SAMN06265182_0328 [Persephonella hydrogeniphila]|uniref:WG containing repeat-containing protein n=1 Tax=Persephonella hydrogeniphila TaxID=198703 RepID=A0A285N5F7_9AQUI|nr:hypothetical protein [Persephonella hydrogeniphila]SNZ03236.1 hypothetical protein SAMN06265182_0328 [Persephonella hydrogeniphila]